MKQTFIHKTLLVLCLFCLSMTAWAQGQITVKGNIVDGQGVPIIGASVMEALTTNGTVTDLDGNFILQVKDEKLR